MTDDLNTLELECGVTLKLQAVSDMLLLDLLEDVKKGKNGQYNVMDMSVKNLNRIMRYFCGWGVKNDIPADRLDEVAMFGNGEHLQRSVWIRMVTTLPELTQIFGQVMALTQIKAKRVQQPTPTAEQTELTELAELRAKVAQLEGDDGGN